ncbi:MAG: polymerase sigma-B factor [Pseudonocardiales bacterium]|nr:polymerase sigma-B factor [Pseudonocardiales bacterium]
MTGAASGGTPPPPPSDPSAKASAGAVPVPDPRDAEYAHLVPLLHEHAALAADEPRRGALRDRLITGYLPVAQHLARRFVHRGVPLEDLVQVATLGLINAVDRFDPAFGREFLAYAIPTIQGELRRYFRDHSWSMRVPRRLKDLHVSINRVTEELAQGLGRAPRPSEIASRLGISLDEVLEGLEATASYASQSLDEVLTEGEDKATLANLLGTNDTGLELVEVHHTLGPLLETLPARERTILVLRFFENMTQSKIAAQLGISQMHVSRLLTQTLATLRERVLDPEPDEPSPVKPEVRGPGVGGPGVGGVERMPLRPMREQRPQQQRSSTDA